MTIMTKNNKKFISLALLFALFATALSACTADTSYALTSEGEKYPAAPYSFYVHYYRDTWEAQLYSYKGTGFNDNADMEVDANGTKLHDYIVDQAKNQYISYLLVNQKFNEFGLSLTEEETKAIDDSFQKNYVEAYGDERLDEICTTIGVSKDELKEILSINYKQDKLIDYYFGEGGTMEVSDAELLQKYEESYARFKYMVFYTKDTSGNSYTLEQQNAVYAKAQEAYAKLQAGETIENLIPQYSEDYKAYTENSTDAEKEQIDKQNKENVEDGVLTDKNGVFNKNVYNYYGYKLDATLVAKIFELQQGEYAFIELSDSFWIVQKYSATEKEDYFASKKEDVFDDITADDIQNLYKGWQDAFPHEFNEKTVEKLDPRGMSCIFLTQEELDKLVPNSGSNTNTTTGENTSSGN